MLLSGAGSRSREPEPEPGQSWTGSTTLPAKYSHLDSRERKGRIWIRQDAMDPRLIRHTDDDDDDRPTVDLLLVSYIFCIQLINSL